jgi:hypothetical protein
MANDIVKRLKAAADWLDQPPPPTLPPPGEPLTRLLRDAVEHIEEMESEQRLFDQDAGEKQLTLDRIADLIGLPNDQEIDATAFELWYDRMNIADRPRP